MHRRQVSRDHGKDHRVLREQGAAPAQGGRPRAGLVRGPARLPQAREGVRDAADPRRLRRRPECRWDNWRNNELNEILAFYGLHYWYTWQVTILGLGPIWMSAQRGGQAKGRPAAAIRARCSRSGCRRSSTAPTSTPREMTLYPDGDGLARARRQVLHRQRQRRAHGLHLRPVRRRRRVRLLRRRLAARGLRLHPQPGQRPVLRRRVRAAGPTRSPRPTSCRAATTPGTRPSTRSTSASSTSAGPPSASAPTPSTRRSTTPPTVGCTTSSSPTSRTCSSCSSTPTRGSSP